MTVLHEKDYTVSAWSGGKTVQLAIGPENAAYADREFLWRVSSATVELEESDYTALPDYMRWITPLDGEMFLTHNGGEEHEVKVLEPYLFDGADKTHCRGRCTDFNLMLRKGTCSGEMKTAAVKSGESTVLPAAGFSTVLIYCVQGAVFFPEQNVQLEKGMSLLVRGDAPPALRCEALSETALVGACIN